MRANGKLPILINFLGLEVFKYLSIQEDSPDELYVELFEDLVKIGSEKLSGHFREVKKDAGFLWDSLVTKKEEKLINKAIKLVSDWEEDSAQIAPSSPLFSKLD
jgi:hypothetical protein